jgi:hypothetical protein
VAAGAVGFRIAFLEFNSKVDKVMEGDFRSASFLKTFC